MKFLIDECLSPELAKRARNEGYGELQMELFGYALEDLAANEDLVNRVLEVTLEVDDQILIRRYALPAED